MKRIIDGVTYNTDTATTVAKYEYLDQDQYDTEATVYQTRGGAFFIVHSWETADKKQKVYFESSSRDNILKLIERTNNLEIINDEILQEPPEAVAETAPAATLYIRVPMSLKDRLEGLARDEKVSLNTWTMRCVERCAQFEKIGAALGEIIQTGLSEHAGADDAGMIQHMRQRAEDIAEMLGWHEKDLENLSTLAMINAAEGSDYHRRWPIMDEKEDPEDRRYRILGILEDQKLTDELRDRWRRRSTSA